MKSKTNKQQNFLQSVCEKVEMDWDVWKGARETEGQGAPEVAVLIDCLEQRAFTHLEESELVVTQEAAKSPLKNKSCFQMF